MTDYESTLQKVAALAVPLFADGCTVDILDAEGGIQRLATVYSNPAKDLYGRSIPPVAGPYSMFDVLRTGKSQWIPIIDDAIVTAMAPDEEQLHALRQLGLKSCICIPLRSRAESIGVLTFATADSGHVYDASDLAAAEDLAHRVGVAIENAKLLAALKDADRRKDEFLAILAHELRNPLAPVRNAVQIVRRKGSAVPELQWATEIIDRQIEQMTRLVDDLLDVSRITRGKIELRKEPVELATIIKSAVEATRPLIDKWEHELTVAMPPYPIQLEADVTRLTQVFLNLLNNAAKYTEQGGRISVSVEHNRHEVTIRIRDTGIGIPSANLPHVFDMFTQVETSLERSQGGLGIGLTLVKRLVEMHGGTVRARSGGPGKGSEFVVRLPIATKATEGDSPGAVEPGSLAVPTHRILVVDDNRDAADSMGMLLRMLGNDVHTAYDGLEAVGAVAAFQPQVVLLDIGLPKLNGFEAARRMRENDRGGNLVLIALTGWGQEEDRRRSKEAGFDYHLTKPVDFADLQKLLLGLNLNRSQ